jgi:hypothetical protein
MKITSALEQRGECHKTAAPDPAYLLKIVEIIEFFARQRRNLLIASNNDN